MASRGEDGYFGALRAIAVDGLAFAGRSGKFPNCLIFSFSCSVSVLVLAVDGGDLWDRLIPNRASYMKSCIADHVGCVIFLCRDGREQSQIALVCAWPRDNQWRLSYNSGLSPVV